MKNQNKNGKSKSGHSKDREKISDKPIIGLKPRKREYASDSDSDSEGDVDIDMLIDKLHEMRNQREAEGVDSFPVCPVNCPLTAELNRAEFDRFLKSTLDELNGLHADISVNKWLPSRLITDYIHQVESSRYKLNQIIICLENRLKLNYECLCLSKDRMEIERIIKILLILGEKINSHQKYVEYGLELIGAQSEKIPISLLAKNPLMGIFANRFVNELIVLLIVLIGAGNRIADLIDNHDNFAKFVFHRHSREDHREPFGHMYL